MRLEFMGKLPRQPCVAVSGGPDSMAVLDFLAWKDPLLLYFNHGTEHGQEAEDFLRKYTEEKGLRLKVGKIDRERRSNESPEEYWRNCRYAWFETAREGQQMITCHHLSDQMEQWIFSSLHGNPTLIPYERDYIIRPFLPTPKRAFYSWCERKNVPFVEDPSNQSDRYARSYIRNKLMPHALKINPGLEKVIRKKVLNLI